MDLSSITSGDEKNKNEVEYEADVSSSLINGKAKLKINEYELTATSLFDVLEIPYAEINSMDYDDYIIFINCDSDKYAFSKMGNLSQAFYNNLYEAYNNAVLKSFFIKTKPVLTAKGSYKHCESSVVTSGEAIFQIFENCIVTLPEDFNAKRVPFCFAYDMTCDNYEVTLKINPSDTYTYFKLGYETNPFKEAIENQLRLIREKSVKAVKEIDSSLSINEASQIAKVMPEGLAVQIGKLNSISSSFVKSIENKIEKTRANESYKLFKELCNYNDIYVGLMKEKTSLTSSLSNLEGHGIDGDTLGTLWFIAPSPNGKYAVVEFADDNSATFIYNTNGDFNNFANQLNRALEAISFKREVIRLADADLKNNSDYYMAVKRISALKFVRSNFVCRIIHTNFESWKNSLTEAWK